MIGRDIFPDFEGIEYFDTFKSYIECNSFTIIDCNPELDFTQIDRFLDLIYDRFKSELQLKNKQEIIDYIINNLRF